MTIIEKFPLSREITLTVFEEDDGTRYVNLEEPIRFRELVAPRHEWNTFDNNPPLRDGAFLVRVAHTHLVAYRMCYWKNGDGWWMGNVIDTPNGRELVFTERYIPRRNSATTRAWYGLPVEYDHVFNNHMSARPDYLQPLQA